MKLLYDAERSGAEWWTLVLDTPTGEAHPKDDEDDDDDEEDDEVGIHFDADYGTYFRVGPGLYDGSLDPIFGNVFQTC
jgi:hypothetical protein